MSNFAVRDIYPNPFRHMDRYPIREDKIEALRESIRSTSFWDNIVGRPRAEGGVELAYGHHRLEAVKRELGPDAEVSIIVRDLNDTLMLRIMANENMEEWGSSFLVTMETVHAVVQAYGEGRIELEPPHPDTPNSYIRTVVRGPSAQTTYTGATVARFLGWLQPSGKPQDKVLDSLSALDFIAEGILMVDHFKGLTTTEARTVVSEARQRKAAEETAARAAEKRAAAAKKEAATQAAVAAKAEADRAAARERATAAKAEDDRAAAEEEERRAAERAHQAKQRRANAEKQQKTAAASAKRSRATGSERARNAGQAASAAAKSGGGTQGAKEAAQRVAPRTTKEGPPKDINVHAKAYSGKLYEILNRDTLEAKAVELIKFRDSLTKETRTELSVQLTKLAERAHRFAGMFADQPRPEPTSHRNGAMSAPKEIVSGVS